jgi:predicted N-acyltransferase
VLATKIILKKQFTRNDQKSYDSWKNRNYLVFDKYYIEKFSERKKKYLK